MMTLPDDPFIIELLPEFVDAWLNDFGEQFKTLTDTKNSADLFRMGHTLKGSCAQFGLNEIADMGVELMEYSKSNDWDKATETEEKIIQAFSNVKKYIEENID